jgi:hypothetical protein
MVDLALNVAVVSALVVGLAVMRRFVDSAKAKHREEEGEEFQEMVEHFADSVDSQRRRQDVERFQALVEKKLHQPLEKQKPGRPSPASIRPARETLAAASYQARRNPPQLRITIDG